MSAATRSKKKSFQSAVTAGRGDATLRVLVLLNMTAATTFAPKKCCDPFVVIQDGAAANLAQKKCCVKTSAREGSQMIDDHPQLLLHRIRRLPRKHRPQHRGHQLL